MEYSTKFIRSSQQPFLKPSSNNYPQPQRKFLTRRDLQLFSVHAKRNYKPPPIGVNSVNSENSASANTDNAVADATSNHLIAQQQHELTDPWLELILSLTFAGIVLLGVVLVGVVLYHWLRRHFRESAKQSQQDALDIRECIRVRVKDETRDNCKLRKAKTNSEVSGAYSKMNSRKWLGESSSQPQQQQRIDCRTVDDLEQRLETVKFKNSPPTSPNNESSCECDDDDDEEQQQQRADGELTCDCDGYF